MKKLTIALTIVAFMTFVTGGVSYSQPDQYERRNGNGSTAMSPGYLNIDKQRSESMKESIKLEATFDDQIERIDADLQGDMGERSTDNVKLNLKKKTGAENKDATLSQAGQSMVLSGPQDIPMGTGEDQDNSDGWLKSEVFPAEVPDGGVILDLYPGGKYIYAGFTDNADDTIQAAIARASSGDIIIVRGGKDYYGDISMKQGVDLYGGYDEYGRRDFINNVTTIHNSIYAEDLTGDKTEINGFTIHGGGSTSAVNSINSNLKLSRNTFTGVNSTYGVSGNDQSDIVLEYNNFDTMFDVVGYGVSVFGDDGTNEFSNPKDPFILNEKSYTYIPVSIPEVPVFNPNYYGDEEDRTITISSPPLSISPNELVRTPWRRQNYRPQFGSYYLSINTSLGDGTTTSLSEDELADVFTGLLQNKEVLEVNEINPALVAKLLEESLRESVLVLPLGELTPQEMEIAMMLANILADPTAEQKVIIDALVSLMNEAQKLEEETDDEELKQASDDFTKMVANILLAQALPDLFKEGEIANIKGIFGNLDTEKSKILLEYQAQARGYYKNIVKELAANITVLQIKDLLAMNLSKGELEKLPADKIDEILNKIRNAENKSITEETILKQEAKYKKEYLIPAKRILEENMKTLLHGFTEKLFGVLNEAGLVKEKVMEGKPTLNIELSAK